MASLVRVPEEGSLTVLDPGAGVGCLTAAIVERVVRERPDVRLQVVAFEIDDSLHPSLAATLQDCEDAGAVATHLRAEDFIEWASERMALQPTFPPRLDHDAFDVVIMNPPYRTIDAQSQERRAVSRMGVDVGNLYAAHPHPALHAQSQRQGRALHPDDETRMGICP